MKTLARLIPLCLLLVPFTNEAQMPASPLLPVPTTKILAIGKFNAPATPAINALDTGERGGPDPEQVNPQTFSITIQD
jgi:hypothetical protein